MTVPVCRSRSACHPGRLPPDEDLSSVQKKPSLQGVVGDWLARECPKRLLYIVEVHTAGSVIGSCASVQRIDLAGAVNANPTLAAQVLPSMQAPPSQTSRSHRRVRRRCSTRPVTATHAPLQHCGKSPQVATSVATHFRSGHLYAVRYWVMTEQLESGSMGTTLEIAIGQQM